jgi:hypothetical protein
MLNKIFKVNIILATILLPILASAQLGQTEGILTNTLGIVKDVLIPLAFTLALLFFFWGVAKYVWSEGQAKAEGKQIMIWGVVALFVMSSIWGIIGFINSDLNLNNYGGTQGIIPTIK